MDRWSDMKTKKILCFGNLNIDLTFFCSRLPEDHEKIKADHFLQSFGGAASNTAFWLSQLGSTEVHMVGCCGVDEFGRRFLEHLEKHGINTVNVQRSSRQTNMVSIWVTPGSKRMVSTVGANQDFDFSQFNLDVFQADDHLHVAYKDADTVLTMGNCAKRRSMSVSMEWDQSFGEQHARVSDICFINRDDFIRCFGVTGSSLSPYEISECWLTLYGDSKTSLVVTLGQQGAMWVTPEGNVLEVSAEKVERVVDRTGGGDAFDAGFLNAYLQEVNASQVLKAGLTLAAKVIQYPSSTPMEVLEIL